ncbi:MAG TPA: hypothetical protein DFI01_02040 [Bacteroidales bacterium]|nr:hypothetical protein [Bacteroidales bacterium]
MSVEQRKRPVLSGEDARRFLENEKRVDEMLRNSRPFTQKEAKEHDRILCKMGTVIKKNVFSNLKEENNMFDEKWTEVGNLLLNMSAGVLPEHLTKQEKEVSK